MTLGLSPVPPQRQAPIVIPQNVPVYRITDDKGFFAPNDTLYPEGSLISYTDEPNENMEPMNELAEEAMRKYLKKLDTEARKVAQKTGSLYTSRADAFENARVLAVKESKTFSVLGGDTKAPVMGAKKKSDKVAKIEIGEQKPILSVTKTEA